MDSPSSTPPTPCPSTITIRRRNPPRRARPTPQPTAAPDTLPSNPHNISSFPLSDILSIHIPPPPTTTTIATPLVNSAEGNSLKVFLRVRPLSLMKKKMGVCKGRVDYNKGNANVKSCVVVNDLHSVTVVPPVCDSARSKSEAYAGFSRVFDPGCSQDDVYNNMMRPIVDEFLNGRSGLIAALGPSGSGKTHTVFGSAKEPGLVPRALRHIFETEVGNKSMSSRLFYLSVFEIAMEKGKGEKLYDLSPDGGDIFMQQSVVKGLKEIPIKDVAQAEDILAGAKLKRATAMTNSNSQSSRSQCIINIRCTIDEAEGESKSPLSGTGLTFVDLAGAERERKTGNQGGRLLESNFINNTSMVFSLCLRSLLEHQKNPKKPLQKHFQSSLLTKYLREYLEGRKRMALILTARSGPEDYFDASFLLRQASPYMEIKFHNVEETTKLPINKRRNQNTCIDKRKRVKLCNVDEKDEVGSTTRDSSNSFKEDVSNVVEDDIMLDTSETAVAEVKSPNAKLQRDHHILQGFVKAMWNVLKEYKGRVKDMQNEIDLLTENISTGHEQYLALEKELQNLRSCCSCPKQLPVDDVCTIGGINSASRVNVMEDPTGHERRASLKMQGLVALECEEKSVLFSAKEQCPLFSSHKSIGMIVPEERHMVSPSECETTSFPQEKDDVDHFVGDTIEKSFSKAGCKEDIIEIILPQYEDSKFTSTASQTIQNVSGEIQDSVPTVACEDHLVDPPTATKILMFVDEKTPHEAVMRMPFEGDALPSHDFESSSQQKYQALSSPMKCEISQDRTCLVDPHEKDGVEKTEDDSIVSMSFQGDALSSRDSESSLKHNNQAQCSPMKCEISHDHVCIDERHEKDAVEKNEKILSDATAHFRNSPVMDLKVQRENNDDITNEKKDKENVTNSPESNFNSKLEAKELSHDSLKAKRPKRRLMPASSLLLRDSGNLDVMDDCVKHKGGKGGQRLAEDISKRTRGNNSLLRLLKNHLPR